MIQRKRQCFRQSGVHSPILMFRRARGADRTLRIDSSYGGGVFMTDDGGAGASKARKKLARHLADHGYLVDSSRPGRPPTDDDFLDLIRDLDLGARSPGSRRAFVIFEWARSEYTIA